MWIDQFNLSIYTLAATVKYMQPSAPVGSIPWPETSIDAKAMLQTSHSHTDLRISRLHTINHQHEQEKTNTNKYGWPTDARSLQHLTP